MDLSIIIVNYIKHNQTIKCIESVIKNINNLSYEIIIIDNNSPNSSYEYLVDRYNKYSNIKVLKNNSNLGFGMANNIGFKYSNGEYILLLNPDVIVLDSAIEKLYNRLLNDNSVGLITCKLLNEDLSLQYSCRRILKLCEFIVARTPLKRFFKKSYVVKINEKYLMKDIDHKKENIVEWVMGSCMLLKRTIFNEVQGFSHEYFMYFEDVDLCYKINNIGKKVLYYPKAQMIHLHNQESTKKINKLSFIHLSSMIKFYRKYGILN